MKSDVVSSALALFSDAAVAVLVILCPGDEQIGFCSKGFGGCLPVGERTSTRANSARCIPTIDDQGIPLDAEGIVWRVVLRLVGASHSYLELGPKLPNTGQNMGTLRLKDSVLATSRIMICADQTKKIQIPRDRRRVQFPSRKSETLC